MLAVIAYGTVAAQCHALDAGHETHEAQHCCMLCHFGPLPLVKAAAPSAPLPLCAVAWIEPTAGIEPTRDALLAASSSRAPPSFFHIAA